MPIRSLKPINPGSLCSQSASVNFSNIHMDRGKISHLFQKQIPPGQHNCNERDMTQNERPLNLVVSLTVMSSEELWLSVPGQRSHCCSHAESTASYSQPHRAVLKMNNMILANSVIYQNSHTNAKC